MPRLVTVCGDLRMCTFRKGRRHLQVDPCKRHLHEHGRMFYRRQSKEPEHYLFWEVWSIQINEWRKILEHNWACELLHGRWSCCRPENPNVIYAGTEAGVWKTTNGGSGWEQAGLADSYVSALAIDPADTNTVYAGAIEHLYKSTNGGSSWTAIEGPSLINAIAVDPKNSKNIYIGSQLWSGGGLFRSADGGNKWVTIGFAKRSVTCVVINPTSSSSIYVGIFDGGVYKSTNSGSSWSAINNGLTSLDVISLAIAPGTPQTIYAGTSSGGIFKLQIDSSETTPPPSTPVVRKVIQLTIGNRTMRTNGKSTILEAAPVILNSRTFLPIRAVVEAAGGTIAWEAAAQKVTIVRKRTTLSLWIGKNTANLNGKSVKIDTNAKVVPIIVSGRTLLPLRFVAEALALDVGWDSKTQVITITYTS